MESSFETRGYHGTLTIDGQLARYARWSKWSMANELQISARIINVMRRNTSVNSDHRKSSVIPPPRVLDILCAASFLLSYGFLERYTIKQRGRHPRNEKSPPDLIHPPLPHPIDRANSRYSVRWSRWRKIDEEFITLRRGERNFTLVRLTRVSEVFVITHAPSDRLVNRACFMYSLNGDILPTVLENSFRNDGGREGRKEGRWTESRGNDRYYVSIDSMEIVKKSDDPSTAAGTE